MKPAFADVHALDGVLSRGVGHVGTRVLAIVLREHEQPEASAKRELRPAVALEVRPVDARAADTLFAASIGPVASSATKAAVQRAPSRAEALATLFACPEFQRR